MKKFIIITIFALVLAPFAMAKQTSQAGWNAQVTMMARKAIAKAEE